MTTESLLWNLKKRGEIVKFLFIETIDVGGRTTAIIESLARFNNLTQEVEKEKKSETRPYTMMPYFAAISFVATTTIMLGFTGGTLDVIGTTPKKDASPMVTMFATSAIFHSYLIGIVAGKISEESVAAGFKHSAVLVVIAVLAAELVPMFLSFGPGAGGTVKT